MATAPAIQLFCFPYAGASAAPYLRWRTKLPAFIQVIPVELPGHGRRIDEPLVHTMSGVIDQIAPWVSSQITGRYALFGHSLGALTAFECALRLQARGQPAPEVLFASGSPAPSEPLRDRPAFDREASDAELVNELRRLGGTPALALENPELMALMLPIVRADFAIAASYRGSQRPAIKAPIRVLAGTDEAHAPAALRAWADHTYAECAVQHFAGNHFFIHECEGDVLASLVNHLSRGRTAREWPERGTRSKGGVPIAAAQTTNSRDA